MKNLWKKGSIFFLIMGTCLLLSIMDCLAAPAVPGGTVDVEVPVSYTPGELSDQHFFLEVVVQGDGSVFDGSKEIRSQVKVYEVAFNAEMSFQLKPDQGAAIKSVIFDGEDMTNQVDGNGYITVKGKAKHTTLKATFTSAQMVSSKSNIQTGDSNYTTIWGVMFLVVSIICWLLLKKKKDFMQ